MGCASRSQGHLAHRVSASSPLALATAIRMSANAAGWEMNGERLLSIS